MSTSITTEPLPLDTITWYAWESDEPESNWLLIYVDMLSVVLAMLVVLLGHLAAQQLQEPQPDESVVTVEQTQVIVRPEPSQEPALRPEPADEPVDKAVQIQVVARPEPSQEPALRPEPTDEPVDKAEQTQVVAGPVPSQEPASQPEPADEPVDKAEQIQVVARPEPSQEPAPQPEPEQARIPSPEERLATAIESRFQGAIRVVQRDQGISLEIADVILFDSGKADLLTEAEHVLSRLVLTLQEIGEADVAVEGHTDDRPILGGPFHSNWELAAARANAVTRYLLSQGFAPKRLRSVSYADTHPVADNATESGRAENRRVNLRVEFL